MKCLYIKQARCHVINVFTDMKETPCVGTHLHRTSMESIKRGATIQGTIPIRYVTPTCFHINVTYLAFSIYSEMGLVRQRYFMLHFAALSSVHIATQ